jgi:hypothetical protein
MYNDLTMFNLFEGYVSNVEYEIDINIVRLIIPLPVTYEKL